MSGGAQDFTPAWAHFTSGLPSRAGCPGGRLLAGAQQEQEERAWHCHGSPQRSWLGFPLVCPAPSSQHCPNPAGQPQSRMEMRSRSCAVPRGAASEQAALQPRAVPASTGTQMGHPGAGTAKLPAPNTATLGITLTSRAGYSSFENHYTLIWDNFDLSSSVPCLLKETLCHRSPAPFIPSKEPTGKKLCKDQGKELNKIEKGIQYLNHLALNELELSAFSHTSPQSLFQWTLEAGWSKNKVSKIKEQL